MRKGQLGNGAQIARALLVGIGAMAVVGVGMFRILRHAQGRVTGIIISRGTSVGNFAFPVDECASGHAFVPGFFGADLRGRRGSDLRVVGTGDDGHLLLFRPGAKRDVISISKADCARWDVLVEWAHLTVNRVATVSGHLHVTCNAGGGQLTADADFDHCAL